MELHHIAENKSELIFAQALTLTGANDYSGATTVSSGELLVSTAFAGGGGVVVSRGAALGVTNASIGSAGVGNLAIAAGAELEFQSVASTTTPLVAASNVIVGGICAVKITGGSNLVAGSSFPLVSYAGAIAGSFTNLQLQMPYGWRGTLLNSGNQISLANVAAVSVTPPPLSASISGQQLRVVWPADHIGWRLQAQTNSLSSEAWVNVAGYPAGLTNRIVFPINEGNGSVFYRLVYP